MFIHRLKKTYRSISEIALVSNNSLDISPNGRGIYFIKIENEAIEM